MTGPDSSKISSLFESIAKSANEQGHTVWVNLRSGGSPNLKTTLKYINQCATSQTLDIQDDEVVDESKVSKRLLVLKFCVTDLNRTGDALITTFKSSVTMFKAVRY